MSTYYKYAEREADSYVNWAEIGKSMSDMLATENKIREEKKAAIDKESVESGKILLNPPQGDHKGLNQWALEYADTAQQARFMQETLLKSGQLKLKDYMVMRQNTNDDTNNVFSLIEEYNAEYSEKMKRTLNNENQYVESFLMEQMQGFSNFTNHKLYIRPTDGRVFVAEVGEDGKMIDDPDTYQSVASLRNRVKTKYDRFDSAASVQAYVDNLGDEINVINNLKNKYQRGTSTEILDITKRKNFGMDENDRNTIETFEQAEEKMLMSMLVDPFHVTSILTEEINTAPNGEDYDYSFDKDKVAANENFILVEIDKETNNVVVKPSDEQVRKAFEHLKTQARLAYDKKEKVTIVGASEKPRPTEAEVARGMDLQTKQSLLDQWMKVYSSTTAADKDAAVTSLLGALKNYDRGVSSVAALPKGAGVVVKWSDGREENIEFKDKSGNLKSADQWAAAGTTLHHMEDSREYSKYRGTAFNDLAESDWADVGASYTAPAATQTSTVSRGQALEQKLASISPDTFMSSDNDVAAYLNQELGPFGFTFKSNNGGMFGDQYVTVTPPVGKTFKIDANEKGDGISARNTLIETINSLLEGRDPEKILKGGAKGDSIFGGG